jgi:hypothetical protein
VIATITDALGRLDLAPFAFTRDSPIMWNTDAPMSSGMIIAVVVVAVFAALAGIAVQRARQAFKRAGDDRVAEQGVDAVALAAAVRLTSGALRGLPSPPWRIVYEIGAERLTGAEHVLIGPPGAFAVATSLDPLPEPIHGDDDPDPVALAAVAMRRGGLDDALHRVRLASAGLVLVHWGGAEADAPPAVAGLHGVTHVDGRRLAQWAAALAEGPLTATQVDLGWQAVVTAIGRPDPLA